MKINDLFSNSERYFNVLLNNNEIMKTFLFCKETRKTLPCPSCYFVPETIWMVYKSV